MTKRKGKTGGKSKSGEYAVIGGLALGGLYLLTRPGAQVPSVPSSVTNIFGPSEQGPPGPPGPSIIQRFTDIISTAGAQTATGLLEAPGAIVIGGAKKMITGSEERTSTEVFGGETKKDVTTFLGTYPPGTTITGTYQQFIQEQPLAFRAAAGAGNIITGQYAAQYGKYMAEETKKGQIMNIGEGADVNYAQRFAKLPALGQVAVTVGQAVTVPLGGGGASGWGAATKKAVMTAAANPLGTGANILYGAISPPTKFITDFWGTFLGKK